MEQHQEHQPVNLEQEPRKPEPQPSQPSHHHQQHNEPRKTGQVNLDQIASDLQSNKVEDYTIPTDEQPPEPKPTERGETPPDKDFEEKALDAAKKLVATVDSLGSVGLSFVAGIIQPSRYRIAKTERKQLIEDLAQGMVDHGEIIEIPWWVSGLATAGAAFGEPVGRALADRKAVQAKAEAAKKGNENAQGNTAFNQYSPPHQQEQHHPTEPVDSYSDILPTGMIRCIQCQKPTSNKKFCGRDCKAEFERKGGSQT